ncbi:TRAP transporter TAXI family solute receptor [Streptomyces sp. SAI-144]|uniref:TAXI family TRAP transporter solute-binding subunit n=1 Tax=unclassified Streptomyces TaxID=2593676 RepID=UPI002476FFB5|nr:MULTISPECIES: TAXI family TRAP transporter solute-binding subunit [unclassified Streptomyces]MDH6437684.1 TRAP transporter TAXI family solute receptor [Streptomyces sp. SAI-144]MDH6485103.1 TRAP transporter TAXI family solute receptor [Streptomyces sp. SAI-127]
MKRRTALRAAFGVTAAAALGGALTGDASSRRPGPRGVLRLATGEPTAFYAAFGRLLAAELRSAHPGLSCHVRTTAGSITNIELIRDGRADLALVLTDTARAAQGTTLFRRPVPLRAIGRVYETYLQFAVRADAPVRSMADLAGHPVSLGAPGSGAALLGERLLHAAGLTPGTDLPVRHLRLADAARRLRTGSIVGLLVAGGVPLPTLTDLDADPGLRFLPLAGLLPGVAGPEGLAASGLEEVELPQDAYRAAAGVATIGVSNLLVCRPDLASETAEALTRLLVLRASAFVPEGAVGAQFLDVRSLIGTGSIPLHPGAVEAYRSLHG